MRRRGLLLCALPAVIVVALLAAWSLSQSEKTPIKSPVVPKSLLPRAQAALQEGDYRSCEELLKVHLREQPADTAGLLILAQVFQRTGKSAETSKLFLALVLSGLLDEEGRRTAIKSLTELTRQDSENFPALKALAICLRDSGDSMGALTAAHKALAIAPGDRELIAVMASVVESATAVGSRGLNSHPPVKPQYPGPLGRRASQ